MKMHSSRVVSGDETCSACFRIMLIIRNVEKPREIDHASIRRPDRSLIVPSLVHCHVYFLIFLYTLHTTGRQLIHLFFPYLIPDDHSFYFASSHYIIFRCLHYFTFLISFLKLRSLLSISFQRIK